MAYKDLTFLLFAKDMGVERAFGEVTRSADRMHAGVKGALLGMGVAVAGAAVAAGAESLKLAADFESSTTRLVTDAGTKASQLDSVKKGILAISSATGTDAESVARGMYTISSAGFTGAQGLKVLHAATEGAKVGYADLGTVSDALTTVLTDFAGKNVPTATEAMNGLIATVSHGKTTMEDLAGSLHNVLPNANAAGLGLSQVLGAMATLTGMGISADQASQNLNHAIVSLSAPSAVASSAMRAVGLSSLDVAQHLGERGLTGTYKILLGAIAAHTKNGLVDLRLWNSSTQATQSFKAEIAGLPAGLRSTAEAFAAGHVTASQWSKLMKQQPATVANLGKQFATTVKQASGFSDAVKHGEGTARTFQSQLEKMTGGLQGLSVAQHVTTGDMKPFKANVDAIGHALQQNGKHITDWGVYQKTLNAQLAVAGTSFKNAGIQIGTALMPALKAILPEIPKIAQDIQNMAPAIAGFAHWLVGVFDNFRDGARQWGEIFAFVGNAVNLWVSRWNQGIGLVIAGWNGFVSFFQGATGWLNGQFANIRGWWHDTVGNFADGARQLAGFITGLVHNFQDGWNQIINGLNTAKNDILGFFASAGTWLVDAGRSVIEGLTSGIRGAVGMITDAVNFVAGLIPSGVKKFLQINSPAKVMIPIGMSVGEGLSVGLLGSQKQVESASGRLADMVIGLFEKKKGGISKHTESVALATIRTDTHKLEILARERASVQKHLKEAEARFLADKKARWGVVSGVRDATMNAGNVIGMGSAGDMVSGLLDMVGRTKRFKADLQRLSKMGVGHIVFDQLVQGWESDPTSALAAADSLIANPMDVKEIAGLEKQLQSAGTSLGWYAGNQDYGKRVSRDAWDVKHFKAEDKVEEWRMQRVAEHMLKTVAKETHVHVHLSGTYAGTKVELGKTVADAIRYSIKSGAISKNALGV